MASGSVLQKSPGSNTYSYSSQPRAAPQRRKYREDTFKDDDRQVLYGNIMYDRRIVRGNTYAMTYPSGASKPDPLEQQRTQEARRRAQARRRAKEQTRTRSPDPVEGRKHIDVQTELYLEEITDRIEEADVQTQTDAFLNRPATPLFIPAKTGADVATQIEEGDLFDFDIEVKPILEVLVGKTVEQALMEVMEEEELASLRAQQREFEENRNAELVETQRLEEQERRHREEKERRMHQQREALLKEKETSEKIAARAFAQSYLNDLVPSVFSILHDSGYFYDTTEREIETSFIPWLMEQTNNALQKKMVARMMVDAMIKDIVRKKMGIKLESSDNVVEGNGDASDTKQVTTEAGDGDAPESKRVVTEAGQDESENQADKAEPTADSQGTEEKEPSVEKPTESVPDDQSSKDTTGEDKTEPKTEPSGEQQTTEEQKESEEQKETEVPATQPPESEAKPVIVEETKAEETTSSEVPATSEEPKGEATSGEEPKGEEGKDEVAKDKEPKEEQPKEQPESEQPKEEQPTDEQPKEEQPKDQEPQEDSN